MLYAMQADSYSLYIPCPSQAEAQKLAHALLEQRLIACANIISSISSLYHWQGEIAEEEETLLIAKTNAKKRDQAIETASTLHPYDCPCVVATPLTHGHAPYFQWIEQELQD